MDQDSSDLRKAWFRDRFFLTQTVNEQQAI